MSGSLLAACGSGNKVIKESESIPSNTIPAEKELKSQYSDNRYGTKLDKINEEETIRASIDTDYGKLYILSNGQEEISRFEAPTSFGAEGDYAFRGNYNLILDKDGDKQVIKELTDFSFVQPSENPQITFDKISFETIDLFLVTPEHIGSRGDNSYAVAVNKETEEPYLVTFKRQDVEREYLNHEEAKPKNEDEKLVIQTRNSEKLTGVEQGLLTIEYSFDEAKKMFIAE